MNDDLISRRPMLSEHRSRDFEAIGHAPLSRDTFFFAFSSPFLGDWLVSEKSDLAMQVVCKSYTRCRSNAMSNELENTNFPFRSTQPLNVSSDRADLERTRELAPSVIAPIDRRICDNQFLITNCSSNFLIYLQKTMNSS